MSRVSHFQRFSQRENHATNNTLLIFRHFYQSSPYKLQRVLSALVDTEISVGLAFEQQIRGDQSVPDALIVQEPLRIFIETKRGEVLGSDQIRRHIETIAARHPDAGHSILLGLTREPLLQARADELQAMAAGRGILFAAVTFSQIVETLRAQCAEFARELIESIEDYEQYLAEEHLLESRNQRLAIVPCGNSFAENKRFALYYEPPTRPRKPNAFLGIYTHKQVSLVGKVETILICSYQNGNVTIDTTEMGSFTDDQLNRIKGVVEDIQYYDLTEMTRFYLVDSFAETTLRKVSPGGAMHRYLERNQIIGPRFDPRKNYTTNELAALLRGQTSV